MDEEKLDALMAELHDKHCTDGPGSWRECELLINATALQIREVLTGQ